MNAGSDMMHSCIEACCVHNISTVRSALPQGFLCQSGAGAAYGVEDHDGSSKVDRASPATGALDKLGGLKG